MDGQMGDITSLLDRCTWHYMKLRIYAHRQAMTIKCPARYHRWARFQGSRSGGCSLLFADVAGKSSRASSPFVVRDTSCSQGFYFMHLCKVSSIQPEPEQIYDEQRRTGAEVMGFLSLWWGIASPHPSLQRKCKRGRQAFVAAHSGLTIVLAQREGRGSVSSSGPNCSALQ